MSESTKAKTSAFVARGEKIGEKVGKLTREQRLKKAGIEFDVRKRRREEGADRAKGPHSSMASKMTQEEGPFKKHFINLPRDEGERTSLSWVPV